MLCLSLSYVEREKGKIAAMRSRQVTGEYGLSQFAINAADYEPVRSDSREDGFM